MNKLSKFIDKLAKEQPTQWIGNGRSERGQAVISSFGKNLPMNTTVTSDTTSAGGVLSTAKTPLGREFVRTENLSTGASQTQQVPKGTAPGTNSFFDGKNIRTGNLPIKPMK